MSSTSTPPRSQDPSLAAGTLGRAAGVALVVLSGCFGKIDPAAVDTNAASPNSNGNPGNEGGSSGNGNGNAGGAGGGGSGPGTPSIATTLVTLGAAPDALANDDAYVYWTELNTVYRASKVAPVREKLFGEGTDPSRSIVADDRYVYAVDTLTGTGRAWPKDGGAIRVVAPLGSHAETFADDATNLYVGRLNQGGIEVRPKATFAVARILREGHFAAQIAVAGDVLFTAELQDPIFRIVRSRVDGTGEATVLGSSVAQPDQLVASGEDAYWIDQGVLESTRGATPLYAPSTPGDSLSPGLSVVGDSVYATLMSYADGIGVGKVLRIPRDGTAPSVIATLAIDAPTGAFRAYGLHQTADATSVYISGYWNANGGTVRGDTIIRVTLPSR